MQILPEEETEKNAESKIMALPLGNVQERGLKCHMGMNEVLSSVE